MEVSYQFEEIGVAIAQDRLVPPLKDMATLLIAAIVILTVGKLQCLHRARERLGSGRQDKMHMIRHEDVRVQRHAVAVTIAL